MGRRMTTDEYIAKARSIHGDKYDLIYLILCYG